MPPPKYTPVQYSNTTHKALPLSGAQIWNNLNPEWKDLSNYRLKKTIKCYLVANYIVAKPLYQSASSNLMRL